MTSTNTLIRTEPCMQCGETSTVSVPAEQYERWKAGALAQVAFPDLAAGERELLMTGTHPACWDEMFGGDDD